MKNTQTNRGSTLGPTSQRVLATLHRHPHGTSAAYLLTQGIDEPITKLRKTLGNLRQMGYLVNTVQQTGAAGWYVLTDAAKPDAARFADALPALSQPGLAAPKTLSRPKTATRKAVEAALQAAGPRGLNCVQLASKTQLAESTVKTVVKTLEARALVERVGQSTQAKVVLVSELAKAEAAKRQGRETPLRNSTTGQPLTATWLRSHSDRPGANDAFTLPSLVGGVRTQPQKPMSMCTSPAVRAMVLGGGRRFSE